MSWMSVVRWLRFSTSSPHGFHGAVELGEMAGDEVAKRRRIAGDAFGKLGAVVGEHLLEGLQPLCQHVAHHVAARRDRGGKRFGIAAEMLVT